MPARMAMAKIAKAGKPGDGKSSAVDTSHSGHLKSKRAKVGGICSELMSKWKTSGSTHEIQMGLAKCRAQARAHGQADKQKLAGNEARSQALRHRATTGNVGVAHRAAQARTLRAARTAKVAARTSPAPTPAAHAHAPGQHVPAMPAAKAAPAQKPLTLHQKAVAAARAKMAAERPVVAPAAAAPVAAKPAAAPTIAERVSAARAAHAAKVTAEVAAAKSAPQFRHPAAPTVTHTPKPVTPYKPTPAPTGRSSTGVAPSPGPPPLGHPLGAQFPTVVRHGPRPEPPTPRSSDPKYRPSLRQQVEAKRVAKGSMEARAKALMGRYSTQMASGNETKQATALDRAQNLFYTTAKAPEARPLPKFGRLAAKIKIKHLGIDSHHSS